MFLQTTGLRQLSLESLNAGHVLGQIRKLEQRWVWLFETNSDLAILGEAYLLRPLTEFLRIDELLATVLAHLFIEDGQNVDGHSQAASAFKVLSGWSAGSGRVNIAADSNIGIAGAGSNSSGAVVAEIQASAKESEPVSALQKHPISRAEARDHFNKIADTAGLRWAWDRHFLANSQSLKTAKRNLSRAPSPALRRLWIETSAAGRVMDQLRKLEEECASLFRSNAEQLIIYQEDLVRPLVEALGIDEMLTGVLVPPVIEDRQTVDRLPKPSATSLPLPENPPRVRKANSAAPLPPLVGENDPATEAGNKVVDGRSSVTWTRLRVTARKESESGSESESESESEPAPVPKDISITRAQARAHFNEIADHAGLLSAWDQLAVRTSDMAPPLYIPDPPSKAAALAKPPVLKSERTIHDAGVDNQVPASFIFSSAAANSHASLADAPARSGVVYPSDQRMVHSELTTNQQKVGQVRWDQVLRPLLETIQSSQRLALRKPASKGTRVGPHRKSERDGPNPVSEIPMTGLRRLADMAVNSDGPSNNTDRQNIFGDRRMSSGASNLLPGFQVATGDETDFASQLAEHLRSEVLRHGIRVENN